MTYELNDKLKGLTPYDALAGNYKIRLDANESFIDPGKLFKDEILAAVADIELNRYPDSMAKELCENFARYYGIDPNSVVAGNGSDELITVIMGAFLKPGDKLLTLTPEFSMYKFYGEIYDKEGIVIEKNWDLNFTAEKILDEINRVKPEAVILSNPCSPTSLVLNREDIIKMIEGSDSLMIIDEAYMDFSHHSIMDVVEQYDNLIVLKTCSKALGCAAIRLGFAISCQKIIKALHCVRSPYNVNAVTQAIGCVIFSKPDYIKNSIKEIIKSRDYLYQNLLSLEENKGVKRIMKPDANFIFIELEDAQMVYEELRKESIIVRRLGDYLRITAGTKEENDSLVAAISKILRRVSS